MSDQPPADVTALLSEAMNKTGVLWVDAEGDRPWPVWHVWDDGAAYVVSGPGEQPLPWLPKDVQLVLKSKDTATSVRSPEESRWIRWVRLPRGAAWISISDSSFCFKCRRADFLMARRTAATDASAPALSRINTAASEAIAASIRLSCR